MQGRHLTATSALLFNKTKVTTEITLLGTGTSQGVPMIACGCRTCLSEDQRDKRLRSSALIRHGGVTLLIDTGPDFRQQMLREKVERIDGVIYTHAHTDHIAGMDDLRAYNYVQNSAIDLYCEERVEKVLHKNFDYAFAENPYPGVPEVVVHRIDDKPFVISGVEVIPIRGQHFKLPILGFRVGEVCYLTDMNRIEDSEIEKFKGVKVLVINALRRQEHISHFTLDQALEIIARAEPQQAYLTHLSHQFEPYSELSAKLPDGVFVGYDGLKIIA